MLTSIQKRALADLNANGQLTKNPSDLTFSSSFFDGCEQHSLHTIQQLIGEGKASPAGIDPNTGYINRIIPKESTEERLGKYPATNVSFDPM